MNFCSHCATPIVRAIPEGDNRERFVCPDCGAIHYQNPRIITGTLPVWEDRVLLCLRAIEPRRDFWTLPAGFLENGETVVAGAARETEEEAKARVSNLTLYTVFSLPHISQCYMFYRGDLDDLDFRAGEESLDVKLFAEDEIPWDRLAFPVITRTLKAFFEDRPHGRYDVRYEDINFRRPVKSPT